MVFIALTCICILSFNLKGKKENKNPTARRCYSYACHTDEETEIQSIHLLIHMLVQPINIYSVSLCPVALC